MNPRKIWSIIKKELVSYFASPIAYVILGIFTLLGGYFFYVRIQLYNYVSLQYMRYQGYITSLNINDYIVKPMFANLAVILLLLIPIVTMKSFAEEKRNGTKELVMTSPVTLTDILIGKFVSACIVFVTMLVFTTSIPIFLIIYGEPDKGIILTTYLGMFLMGSTMIAIGMFASSITENQIVAAVITFGLLLLFWAIGWVSHGVSPGLSTFLSYLSLIDIHFQDMIKGIIDTRDIVYYLSGIFFFLFLTHRVLESERWR
ncbi:MAG: ABC transporter permease [Deltaproteobacteria bacterium]|nr:ABC transporter permease [Deltaproteobacteria bacterium]MCL5276427.1 ABC transporter permease [Deltaproteobacteria bacterium]